MSSRTYKPETRVYGLLDPRTKTVRYVGRSVKPDVRFRSHLREPRSPFVRGWIEELRAIGLEPELALLDGGTEREWILRLKPDLNVYGGDGDQDTRAFIIRLSKEERAALEVKMRTAGFWTISAAARAAFAAWDPGNGR